MSVSVWSREAVVVVGLLLAGVLAVEAQPAPQPSRVRAELLYGPSGPQAGGDTTTSSSRRLEAGLHLGGGLLATGGAVGGSIQAARLFNQGASRPLGAVLAVGSVGLGVAGALLIRRGVQLLRQDRTSGFHPHQVDRGPSFRVVWKAHPGHSEVARVQ